MKIFGALHLTLLAATLLLAALLSIACRRLLISPTQTRLALGAILAVNETIWWIYRYSREGIHRANLPLQLCDALVWLSVLACFTLWPLAIEFAYFAGIAGAGLALLTPDLISPWPSYPAIYFFIAHSGIVIAVLVLTYGGFIQFRPGAVPRSFGLLLCYGLFAGASMRSMAATICTCAPSPKAALRSIGLVRGPGIWPAPPRWGSCCFCYSGCR